MTIHTDSVKEAAQVIRQGGVIICPTEGVYGISCSVFNEEAVSRVIAIKQRDVSKGLIIVDSALDCLNQYIAFDRIDDISLGLIKKMWPGPHTFVLPVNDKLKTAAIRENRTVAVRITAFDTLSQLCSIAQVPVISTSANISGQPATDSLDRLDPDLCNRVDLVLTLPCSGQSEPTSIYDTQTRKLVRKGPHWIE
ncbi:MAG: L-threonylcarbamoyladenylate synthase [Succinivibrio sp.]